MSIAFSLFLACPVLASALAIHDGLAARSVIEAVAALALASVGVSARSIDVSFAARSSVSLRVAAAIPAIWMVIQILPTPVGGHSIWAYANEALGRQSWGHISIDPGRTVLALAFYLTSIALIVVSIFVARDRRRAELVLFTLTAVAAITTLGLLVGKSGFIASVPTTNDTLGGVSALGILLSLACVARAIERSEMAKSGEPAANVQTTLIACAIALTVNLAGLIAGATLNVVLTTLFGVVTFGSIQVVRGVGLGRLATSILIGTLVIAAAMIVVWRFDPNRATSPLLQFASASSQEAASTMQRLLSDARWLGTGAGTFAAVLPIYQDLGSSLIAPPSTISGLAIEIGLPMSMVAVAIALWLTVILYRGALHRGRDSFYPAVAAAGTLTFLCEAFCDASFMNSCVATMGAVLIGLGLAQCVSGRDSP